MAKTLNEDSSLNPFQPLNNNGSMADTPIWFFERVNGSGEGLPDVYMSASRFRVETMVAVIAAGINLLTVVAVLVAAFSRRSDRRRADPSRSPRGIVRSSRTYERLFVNITVSNVFSSAFSWMSNNAWKLFGGSMQSSGDLCQFYVWMPLAVYASTSFIFVGTLTMLGFSVIQYRAIGCVGYRNATLPSTASRRCGRDILCIVSVWTTSLLAGLVVPFAVLMSVACRQRPGCDMNTLYSVLVYTINVQAALLVAIYITITFLCCLIYSHIRSVRREVNRFRTGVGSNRNGGGGGSGAASVLPVHGDVRTERRAFSTLGMLIGSLAVFFVPYLTFHIVSLNVASVRAWMEQPGNETVVYYMSLLPYVRYAIDPIVYGLRMRDTRDGFRILFGLVTSATGRRRMFTSNATELHSLSEEIKSTTSRPTTLL